MAVITQAAIAMPKAIPIPSWTGPVIRIGKDTWQIRDVACTGDKARQQLAEQLLDGVIAEERGEQHADRRRVRQRRRRGTGTP